MGQDTHHLAINSEEKTVVHALCKGSFDGFPAWTIACRQTKAADASFHPIEADERKTIPVVHGFRDYFRTSS